MRLFLSSYRFGAHQDILLRWVPPPARVAVIGNALDAWGLAARRSAVTSDLVPLRALGYAADELDLRDFIEDPSRLRSTLAQYALLWVRGGNTFVLRAQLVRSGADAVIPQLLTDGVVYAGYSAGACVMCPSLRGLEHGDPPSEVFTATGIEPRFDGLALVDRLIVPHVGSQSDLDGTATRLAAELQRDGVPHYALSDDQAVVVNGTDVRVL